MFDLSLAETAIIFLGNFCVVFLLGLQSRNVQAGRYLAAVLVSAGINVSNFIFVKYAANGALEVLGVSTLGGCMGIASAIWFYQNVMERNYNMATKKPAKASPTPKEVTEKVSKRNGLTDISKKKDLRESGTDVPVKKKAK